MRKEPIRSIDEYIEKVNPLIDSGYFAYRGQCCSTWALEPGIIRRIKKTYDGIGESGLLFTLCIENTLALIDKARKASHFTDDQCDLIALAILQHYGAATPLLDFTYDPLVALYFACQPHENEDGLTDGKVFCISYSKQIRSQNAPIQPVTDPSLIDLKSDLSPGGHRGIWYWRPPDNLPCARSAKQESVFVFGWDLHWKAHVDRLNNELEEILISADRKESILAELEEKHDISEKTLFPDIFGFAQSHGQQKIIECLSYNELYAKGDLYWDGSPEWAAEYYRMAYTKKPNSVDARSKCALSLNIDGYQSDALKVIADSIEVLGEHWKLLICRSLIKKIECNEWEEDLRKASILAEKSEELGEFKDFKRKYAYDLCESD